MASNGKSKFRQDFRRNFFTVRLRRHWNWLPRGTVYVPSVEVFKPMLDGTLNNLENWKVSLAIAEGFEADHP